MTAPISDVVNGLQKVSEIVTFKENNITRAMIYPFRVISKLSWFLNKLRNGNEIISLSITDLQNDRKFFCNIYTVIFI